MKMETWTDDESQKHIEDTFTASIQFLNSAAESGLETSNADKLRLYGYFKQATEGSCKRPRPEDADIIDLTKWRAWRATSALSKNAAMRGYIRIVDMLAPGWRERDGVSIKIHSLTSNMPAIVPEPPPGVERKSVCGFLYRQKYAEKGWLSRYFVLEGRILFQYQTVRDNYPDGLVYLEGCQFALDCSLDDARTDIGESLYPILIVHQRSGKRVRLGSRSLHEAKRWVDSLRNSALTVEIPTLGTGKEAEQSKSKYRCKQPSTVKEDVGMCRSDSEAQLSDDMKCADEAEPEETETQLRINELIGSYAEVESSLTEEMISPSARYAAYQAKLREEKKRNENKASQSLADQKKLTAWREVAKRFEFPEEYASDVGQVMETLVRYTNNICESWEDSFQLDGVSCYVSRPQSGIVGGALGRTEIKASALSILDIYWDLSCRHKVDPLFAKGRVIEQFGSQTRIEHIVYKPIWPTTARDFCNVTHWRILEDGLTLVIASKSVIHPSCPHRRGAVRGFIHGSGLVIKQLPTTTQNPLRSEVFYFIQSDPMGSVPGVFTRNVQGRRPMVLQQLRNYIEPQVKKVTETTARKLSPIAGSLEEPIILETTKAATFIANKGRHLPPKRRDSLPRSGNEPANRYKSQASGLPSVSEELEEVPSTLQINPEGPGMESNLPGKSARRRLTLPRRMHLAQGGEKIERFNGVNEKAIPRWNLFKKILPLSGLQAVAEDGKRMTNVFWSLISLGLISSVLSISPNIVQVASGVDSISLSEGTLAVVLLVILFKVLLSSGAARSQTFHSFTATVDVSSCNRWINAQRGALLREPGLNFMNKPVALPHLIVKALSMALKHHNSESLVSFPFGTDISYNLFSPHGLMKTVVFQHVTESTVQDIANKTYRTQNGDGHHDSIIETAPDSFLAAFLPVWLIRYLISFSWLFGVLPESTFEKPQVSNFSTLQVDAVAPVKLGPISLSIGPVKELPLAINGTIVIRPQVVLAIAARSDYFSVSDTAQLASRIRYILLDPLSNLTENRDVNQRESG